MLAIIPARGGSKRLPGKNINLLKGKPLIAYTIEAALEAGFVDKVMVSTDCPMIADISIKCGAFVPSLRPNELATDYVSSLDVLEYSIQEIEIIQQKEIDECILLQPTSPLRSYLHIDEAIQMFYDKQADAVISFTKEQHPLHWNKYLDGDCAVSDIPNLESEKESYYPNGALYVLRKKVIRSKQIYTDQTYAYIMDRRVSWDIDTQDDWDYVEYLLNDGILDI